MISYTRNYFLYACAALTVTVAPSFCASSTDALATKKNARPALPTFLGLEKRTGLIVAGAGLTAVSIIGGGCIFLLGPWAAAGLGIMSRNTQAMNEGFKVVNYGVLLCAAGAATGVGMIGYGLRTQPLNPQK